MQAYARITTLVMLGCALTGATTLCAQERVADWGDPDRVVIEGAETYPAREVREELRGDLDVVVASHPSAPLEEYTTVLANRAREGFLHCGFPQATVQAHLDRTASRIVLSVEEGPRYVKGAVRVKGTVAIDPARLIKWLTNEQPPTGSRVAGFNVVDGQQVLQWVTRDGSPAELRPATWETGDELSFAAAATIWKTKQVRRALNELGYWCAKFKVSLELDDDARTASLAIEVEDEGAPAKIDRIVVEGSTRDSQAEVLAYLAWQPGLILTEPVRSRLEHKLWLSGRYLHQRVELVPPKDPVGPMGLRIKLKDYAKAAPLRESLPPEEQAMLKCREWVLDAIARGDALVVSASSPRAEWQVVLAEGKGILCLLEPCGQVTAAGATPGNLLLAAMPGALVCAQQDRAKKLEIPVPHSQFIIPITMTAAHDDTEHPFRLMISAGAKFADRFDKQVPVNLVLGVAPVATLGLLHSENTSCAIRDGVLTLDNDEMHCRIDAATGAVLECWLTLSDEPADRISISIEPDGWAKRLESAQGKIGHRLADLPNAYDSERPVGSTAEFLLGTSLPREILSWLGLNGEQLVQAHGVCEVLQKLIARGLMQPVDDALAGADDDDDDDHFQMPVPSDAVAEWSPFGDSLSGLASHWAFPPIDRAFPRGSWPWTLCRGAVFMGFGKMASAGEDIAHLSGSNDFGPIAHMAAGLTAELVSGDLAVQFAASARDPSSLDGFRADYRPFLMKDKLAGALVCRAAELLRDLDDDDVAHLGDALLGDRGDLLVAAAKRLREQLDKALEDVLPAVFDEMWSAGLDHVVSGAIARICDRNAPVAATPKTSPHDGVTAIWPAATRQYNVRNKRRSFSDLRRANRELRRARR